jgi:hypothetical protein
MAKPGEIEVFRISPSVGKCYQHVEATRSEYVGEGNHRYFSTNTPTYVGTHVRDEWQGYGDGMSYTSIFNNNGKEVRVDYSYAGFTCFIKVPCILGGGAKSRKSRKLNKRRNKTKSKKMRR